MRRLLPVVFCLLALCAGAEEPAGEPAAEAADGAGLPPLPAILEEFRSDVRSN